MSSADSSNYSSWQLAMDVNPLRKSTLSSSLLNPNGSLFNPLACWSVEDFSDQWRALVLSSPLFHNFCLRDPHSYDIDELFLSPLDAFVVSSENQSAGEKKGVSGDLITKGALKWRKGRIQTETPRYAEKVKKIVNVKVSPRMIQQPR